MNYIITSRTAAGKCDEATPALLISNCPRCSEPAWPAAALPPGYRHPASFHLLEKNQRCGSERESSHCHCSSYSGEDPSKRTLGLLHLEIIPSLCPGGGTTSFQSPSVFCRGKSWSCKEIELILNFPRDFLRLLSFSQQPHTSLDRKDTFPIFPALGMRYSPVERTQCPENGEELGSLFTGRSSWKQ